MAQILELVGVEVEFQAQLTVLDLVRVDLVLVERLPVLEGLASAAVHAEIKCHLLLGLRALQGGEHVVLRGHTPVRASLVVLFEQV